MFSTYYDACEHFFNAMLSPYLPHNQCSFPHFQTYDTPFVTDKVKCNIKEMSYSLYAKKRERELIIITYTLVIS